MPLRQTRAPLLLIAALACTTPTPDATKPEPVRPFALGPSAWDGLYLDLEEPYWDDAVFLESGGMYLSHEDGEEFGLQLHGICQGRWVSQDSLARGSYDRLELRGLVQPAQGGHGFESGYAWQFDDGEFEVGAWGKSDGFTPQEIEGALFKIDYESMQSGGFTDLLGEFLESMLLEIEEATEDQVRFRWIQQLSHGDAEFEGCVYLEDTASLSATGEMQWERDELALSTDPQIGAYHPSLHLGFDPWGQSIAGIELAAMLDLAGQSFGGPADTGSPEGDSINDSPQWQEYCEVMENVTGHPCHECPVGDLEACAEFTFYAGQATRTDLVLGGNELPACSVALPELPDFQGCDIGCSGLPGKRMPLAAWGLAFVAMIVRRRRT